MLSEDVLILAQDAFNVRIDLPDLILDLRFGEHRLLRLAFLCGTHQYITRCADGAAVAIADYIGERVAARPIRIGRCIRRTAGGRLPNWGSREGLGIGG